MFTGLVTDVGRIAHVADSGAGRELRVETGYTTLVDGESIAVNGACLTVREHGAGRSSNWFTCAAVVTTLDRTTIGGWKEGTRVNLERALRVGDRLGGHMVLGHVDCVGIVGKSLSRLDALLVDVILPEESLRFVALHGSVTIDGVSLTVNSLLGNGVQISVIDYTLGHTNLGDLAVGSRVHVETDVIAKHVGRLLESRPVVHQVTT